jgi:hypothetical protein
MGFVNTRISVNATISEKKHPTKANAHGFNMPVSMPPVEA